MSRLSSRQLFLVGLVTTCGEEFLSGNVTLEAIERGELSREDWRMFATQRYLAALPFDGLLVACSHAARRQGQTHLAEVVEANWRDETGVDAYGVVHEGSAHGTWRRDFYAALGISEDELARATPATGTLAYANAIEKLCAEDDALVMAGALLLLEGTIPREFMLLKRGRDLTFAEAFVDQSTDAEDVRCAKARARMYLDDHIVHDARRHYPDLLGALEDFVQDEASRDKIVRGVQVVAEAKRSFYEEWRAV